MVTGSRKFTVVLAILRVMGGFPYRWEGGAPRTTFRSASPSSLPSPPPSSTVRASKGWLCWTALVSAAAALHVVSSLCATATEGGSAYANQTLNRTRSAYRVWKAVLLGVTAAFAISTGRALARIVASADALCRDLALDADASLRRRHLVNPIFWQSSTLVVVVVASVVRCAQVQCDALRYCLAIMDAVARIVYPMILTLLYLLLCHFLSSAYSQLTASLAHPHDRLDDPRIKLYSLDVGRSGRKRSGTRRDSPLGGSRDGDGDDEGDSRSSRTQLSLTRDADRMAFAEQVLRLQDFHRKLNRHFGSAVTLVIVYCMSTCIVAAFSLSFFTILHWEDKLMNVVYFIHSFIPLIVLTNSPLILEGEVLPWAQDHALGYKHALAHAHTQVHTH